VNPYHDPTWATAVRHWKRLLLTRRRLACARCGGTIRVLAGRGPDSLDVGHIIAVAHALQLGWSAAEMNALTNTQPEHQRCNRRAGAELGNKMRARARPAGPVTTREW
jgi:hypothetical protein